MKQLVITNDVAADSDIRALLRAVGIPYYTRFPRCAGSGPRTGFREDDHVWPGYNVMTVAVVEDDVAMRALEALRAYRDDPAHAKFGLFAYLVPVEATL